MLYFIEGVLTLLVTFHFFPKHLLKFIFFCPRSLLLHAVCLYFHWVVSSRGAQASHCDGFSCCRAGAMGHVGFSSCVVWAQQLWLTGLVALWHVRSSRMRDQTCVPCAGRSVLYRWTTRGLQVWQFLFYRKGNRNSQKLSNFSKVTQPIKLTFWFILKDVSRISEV